MTKPNVPWLKLEKLRLSRTPIVTQSGLDKLIGKPRGTTAQIEAGKLLPPDFDLSARIDTALGLTDGTTWAQSAPDRLKRLDPHLAEWATTADVDAPTPTERLVISGMRLLAHKVALVVTHGDEGRALRVHMPFTELTAFRMFAALKAVAEAPGDDEHGPAVTVFTFLETLRALSPKVQARVWDRCQQLAFDAAVDSGAVTASQGAFKALALTQGVADLQRMGFQFAIGEGPSEPNASSPAEVLLVNPKTGQLSGKVLRAHRPDGPAVPPRGLKSLLTSLAEQESEAPTPKPSKSAKKETPDGE